MSFASEPLYIGINGHVVAIDRATGAEIWRCKLKSSPYVTVHSDASGLYAGANGELFCIDRVTGSVVWQNGLQGLGYHLITFSGMSQTTAAAKKRAEDTAAAAAVT